MAFPFLPMLVIVIFTVSEKIAPRLGAGIPKTLIAKILMLLIVIVQLYRFESFIPTWKTYTDEVKSETTQLLSQAGDIKKGDHFILMVPAKEQDGMTRDDDFIKQIKVLLGDPTIQVEFQLFDSTIAAQEFQNPRSNVMVGVPSNYVPYSPALDISKIIPKDPSSQYPKWLEREKPKNRKKTGR